MQGGTDVFPNVLAFFCKPACLIWSLISESLLLLRYRVSAILEDPLCQYGQEQSWRNLRFPEPLETDWSGAGGRVRKSPAPAMHHTPLVKALDTYKCPFGSHSCRWVTWTLSTWVFAVWTLSQVNMGISTQVFNFWWSGVWFYADWPVGHLASFCACNGKLV